MLHLHFSNRHEVLAERLADALAASRAGVFGAERVLVPSAAWQRWLSIHLAHRLGVCAQVEFGFLAPWLWRALPADDPLRTPEPDTEALAWRCWAWLGDPATHEQHPLIARWLAAGAGPEHEPRTRYELARRAAGLIEQFDTWRPGWRDAWARGASALPDGAPLELRRHEAWQAELWRHLRGKAGDGTAASPRGDEAGADAGGAAAGRGAVHLFAPASMPPVHLAALRRLAAGREIHAYLFNPCREYWFDLVSPRRFSHLALAGRLAGHEVGHALLTRWGGAVQAQLAQWHEAAGEEAVLDDGHYVAHADAAAEPSLLGRVQDSLLTLEEPAPGAWTLADDDRSLELHLCHSRQRELEVLLDRLLALLAADPGLGPGDIWVGVTDLDATAPLIEAVFGAATGARALPFTVTGRSASQGDGWAADLLAVLDLAGSRCTATALLGVLQLPRVAGALGLDEPARADAVAALNGAGLRWGLDDAHLAAHGAPPHGHTLADAIERLALGACLPADPRPVLAAAVAVGDASAVALPWPAALPAGQAGWRLLGALQRWAQALSTLAGELRRARPALAWQRLVERTLEQVLQDPAHPAEVAARQPLQRAIAAVATAAHRALGPVPVPWSAMREALAMALETPARGGVAGGGVTFSALAPLRGLPFRVVAVLGLDDGLFPQSQRAAEFDLIAALPQPGDRQRRLDDRSLMLEALLACRGTLHLSAIGRSAADNSVRPPSAVVSELLEWLLPAITPDPASPEARAAARRRVVVEHPLQPFDLAAYDTLADPRSRSSEPAAHDAWRARLQADASAPEVRTDAFGSGGDAEDLDDATAEDAPGDDPAAQSGRRPGVDTEAPPFVDRPLAAPSRATVSPEPPQAAEAVDAADLMQWLRHPARHWLRHGLGLAVWQDDDATADEEELDTGGHGGQRRLWQHWLPLLLAGDAPAPSIEHASAWTARAGIGPGGPLGAAWLAREWPRVLSFAAAVRQAQHECAAAAGRAPGDEAPTVAAVDVPLARPGRTVVLRGVPALGPQAVFWHIGRLNGAQVAQAWLHHLLALAAAPGLWDPAHVRTRLLTPGERGSDEILRTVWPPLPVEQAREHLGTLLALHERGRHEPLLLLPRTGWAWVESGRNLGRALSAWAGRQAGAYGEGQDPSWRLALRGRPDPFEDLAFVPLVEAVFGPALHALRPATPAAAASADASSPASAGTSAP